jgi:hypothetical protein
MLALSLTFCAEQKEPPTKQDTTKSKKTKMTITEVLTKYTDTWMSVPGVIGTGEGKADGKPSVVVFVDHKSDTIEKKIPKTIEGYKVVIEVTGTIEALPQQ